MCNRWRHINHDIQINEWGLLTFARLRYLFPSMSLGPATKSFMLLGRCVPGMKQNASKFKVKRLELDTNLLMVRPLRFKVN